MTDQRIFKHIRILTLLTAGFFICAVMFSNAFIAVHSGHECDKEECPVCTCLELCESIIRNAGSDSLIHTFLVVLSFVSVYKELTLMSDFSYFTPVSQKVRLND